MTTNRVAPASEPAAADADASESQVPTPPNALPTSKVAGEVKKKEGFVSLRDDYNKTSAGGSQEEEESFPSPAYSNVFGHGADFMERLPLDQEYVRSKNEGCAANLWTAQTQVTKGDPICLAVMHKLMAKSLEDNNEGDVYLVGTMINTVAGIDTEREDFNINRFRINDLTATDEMIDVRRKVPATGFGMRTTMNVRIPLKKEIVFGVPPYCSALVEMQTSSITHDGEEKDDGFEHVSEVRPNIYVNKMDERELFVVRKWQELNQMDQYDLITEAPRIEVEFETKAMYCPKYKVSFYMLGRLQSALGDRS
eukprot:gene15592-34690_t